MGSADKPKVKGLLERLENGGNVIIGEGYMWEFERRGYLQFGCNIPEVVLENPELVKIMHQEFVHAGSDVVEAFTYYGNRSKLRTIGREDDLEKLNKVALRIAREVADETGSLMAGNLCNTAQYSQTDKNSHTEARNMFIEQVEWAVDGGCDYIIAETFSYVGEALIALDVIKKYGKGVPAVITLTPYVPDITLDDVPFPEACRQLEEAGADVVGLNCSRGPVSMMPLLKEVRKICKGPIACLPVPYRCDDKNRTFFAFKDSKGNNLYPVDLQNCLCNNNDIKKFAKEAKEIGVQYVGLCCGNAANSLRTLAEEYGRKPPASRYAPDMTKNTIVGEAGAEINTEIAKCRKFSSGDFSVSDLQRLNLQKKSEDAIEDHDEH